jgi:SAM-dependent methyltransferase
VNNQPVVHWTENDQPCTAQWRPESGAAPTRVVAIDDRTRADDAYGLAAQGVALLWRGDFQNARQMLVALGRRADRPPRRTPNAPLDFHRYRQLRAQRARTLGMLILLLDADYRLALPRAPDLRDACLEAFGPASGPTLISLRAVLGAIGAHEWRTKGIGIPAAGGRIHPHYGVFAPVRSEYVDLVAAAPLPPRLATCSVAFDIGTGTGVLAAVLARRGIRQVCATELDPRALLCAQDNIGRLGLDGQVRVVRADLFPAGRAALVVCNPPWLPARPSSALEHAVYDPDSRMLRAFLAALPDHLESDGEGWLILSDLAEHLGLRSRAELLTAIEAAHLAVLDRHEAQPRHRKASDPTDLLHGARAAEVTSLWRLAAR